MRVAIAGGPWCGKTELAKKMAAALRCPVIHCDAINAEFAHLPQKEAWSAVSDRIAALMAMPGPWVMEGCRVAYGARKALDQEPEEKPFDRLVVLDATPFRKWERGQESFAKAQRTVLTEVWWRMEALGVEIDDNPPLPRDRRLAQ